MAIAVDVVCPDCKRPWTKLGYPEDHGKEFVCKDCDPREHEKEHAKTLREHQAR